MADEIVEKELTLATETVQIGSTVKVKCLDNNQEREFSIVNTADINIARNEISAEGPFGKAFMEHEKGDIVSIKAPAGTFKYEILEISILS